MTLFKKLFGPRKKTPVKATYAELEAKIELLEDELTQQSKGYDKLEDLYYDKVHAFQRSKREVDDLKKHLETQRELAETYRIQLEDKNNGVGLSEVIDAIQETKEDIIERAGDRAYQGAKNAVIDEVPSAGHIAEQVSDYLPSFDLALEYSDLCGIRDEIMAAVKRVEEEIKSKKEKAATKQATTSGYELALSQAPVFSSATHSSW